MSITESINCPHLYPDVAALLLAGGKSRRMGRDKALLRVNGKLMLQLLATRLLKLTDQVIISANDPAAYAFLGLPVIPDAYPEHGPLGGVHAAMLFTPRPLILVLACDLPGVPARMLRHMIDQSAGFDAVIPCSSDGILHPVCAVYRRTCLQAIEENLLAGKNRMLNLLNHPSLRICRISSQSGTFTDADLLDVNFPEDFEEFRHRSKC